MTDRSKFELMLDALINEQQDKAKEIFHNIVVEKSREIYENLLADDFNESGEPEPEFDTDMEENFGLGMEASDEESDDDSEIGGDASDDFMSDVEDDGEGSEDDMGGEGDIEDRVMDLEDALDELKAEFEQLMSGEEGDDMGGMDDMGDMGDDDMGGMGMDEPEDEGYAFETGKNDPEDDDDLEESLMREYVEKVGGATYDKFGKMGDNGQNTKSIVAKANNMGGTTANIAKGGESKGEGTKGGLLAPTTKDQTGGNVNTPGSKNATKWSNVSKGHGAEKKGTGEQADNKRSIVGSR